MRNLICFVTLSIMLFSGCITEKDIKVNDIKEFQIQNMSGSGMQCIAEVEVQNNYFLPLTIENGDICAYAGKEKVGTVKILKPIKLKAKSKQLCRLEFEITIAQPIMGLQSLLGSLSGNKTSYRLKGTLKAKQFFFSREIEFDKSLNE